MNILWERAFVLEGHLRLSTHPGSLEITEESSGLRVVEGQHGDAVNTLGGAGTGGRFRRGPKTPRASFATESSTPSTPTLLLLRDVPCHNHRHHLPCTILPCK